MNPNVFGVVLGLLLISIGLSGGCTQQQLTQVQDASNKRDTICRFVEVWAPSMPELEKPRELCRAGATVKEVAAAYAGCYTEVPNP